MNFAQSMDKLALRSPQSYARALYVQYLLDESKCRVGHHTPYSHPKQGNFASSILAALTLSACAKPRYLKSTVRMMLRDKENLDAAMGGFIAMLEEDKDNVPAMLGMSTAFVLEDSPNKVCRLTRYLLISSSCPFLSFTLGCAGD